jgi:hypothetical protein
MAKLIMQDTTKRISSYSELCIKKEMEEFEEILIL